MTKFIDKEAVAPQAGRRRRSAVLILTDLVALLVSGTLAYFAWARPVYQQPPEMYLSLVPLVALFLLGYAQMGLYPGIGLGPVETLRRLSLVTAYGFLGLAAVSFAFKLPHTYSRATFGLALVSSLLLVPLLRVAVVGAFARRPWWPEPVLLVGPPARIRNVREDLARSPRLGYRPVACLPTDDMGEPLTAGPEAADPGLPLLTDPADLAGGGVRVAFVLGEAMSSQRLDELQRSFRHVVQIRTYAGLPIEGIQIRNLGRMLGIEYTSNLLVRRNRIAKRMLDLAVASVCLVLALPVIAIAAVAVMLTDPGSPLYVQRRSGLGGRRIAVPKIRTMYRDAERRLESCLASDPRLAAQWERNLKLANDPRILPGVGHFLRRFSLDELPQLWSVVRGRMSLVGPRPFPDYHLERFSADFLALRERVRPGLSGLWQVTVRSSEGIEEQQAYDSYYIRNWSLWLDVYVLGRTLGAVLGGKGAY